MLGWRYELASPPEAAIRVASQSNGLRCFGGAHFGRRLVCLGRTEIDFRLGSSDTHYLVPACVGTFSFGRLIFCHKT